MRPHLFYHYENLFNCSIARNVPILSDTTIPLVAIAEISSEQIELQILAAISHHQLLYIWSPSETHIFVTHILCQTHTSFVRHTCILCRTICQSNQLNINLDMYIWHIEINAALDMIIKSQYFAG